MNKMAIKEVKRIMNDWDLNSQIKDKEILSDIADAIMEAYIIGAGDGGMDNSVFEEALSYEF